MATGPRCFTDDCCEEEKNEDLRQEQAQTQPPKDTARPHHGGYDCEFVTPPPVEFPQTNCPVCLLVLREPHQVACCGNSYCEACVKRVQDDMNPCPTCNETHFTTFLDKRLKRSLYALKVYCCQRKKGCEWAGELGELGRHLNLQPPPEKLLVGCQFAEVKCTYCTLPFLRCYIQTHQSNECPKRPYACQHCNRYTATYDDVTQNHLPECPCLPLSCPNKCGLVLQRQMLERHVSRDCLLTIVQCDFHVVGCQARLLRRNVLLHITANLAKHTSLLQAHMTTHPEENITTYMRLTVNCLQKLVMDNADTWSNYRLPKAIQSQRETSHKLEQTRVELQQTRDELQQTRLQLKEMQDRVAQLEARDFPENQTTAMQAKKPQKSPQQDASNISQQNQTLDVEQDNEEHRKESRTLQKSLTDHKLQEFTEMLSVTEKNLQTMLSAQQSVIAKCRNDARIQERKQLESESKLTAVKVGLACRITASEQMIQTHEATLAKHQMILEKMTCIGTLPFEFTMTDYEKHKKASDEWYSPPFYTHTHGYRMCIRVDANGWGPAKGTHISVFGYLMQGEFDDELQWPFQGAITLHLLNQLGDRNHHRQTINFTEVPNPVMASRVTSGKRANSGLGKPSFISHPQLGLNTSRHCQYLKEKQLKFRIFKATNLDPVPCIHRRCLALKNAIDLQICVIPVEFTLSNFEQHKNQNIEWYSPPFYTHPQGYQMCLRVDPSGNGEGKGTHVSVFTCLMRGPFDDSLRWPFRGNVTIRIMNQVDGSNHHEGIIPYTDHTPDSATKKVTDGKRSLVWGKHQFLSQTSLGYNAVKNTEYLRGDSLRIQILKVELKTKQTFTCTSATEQLSPTA